MAKAQFAHGHVDRLLQHQRADHQKAAFERGHEDGEKEGHRHCEFDGGGAQLVAAETAQGAAKAGQWVNLRWLMLLAMARKAVRICKPEALK